MRKLIMMIGAMLIGLAFLTNAVTYAQEESIDPLSEIEKATPANWSSDVLVWKIGTIDGINNDTLLINDTRYRIADDTRFCRQDGTAIKRGNFSKGEAVTFVLKEDRKTVMTIIEGEIPEKEE